MKRLFLLLMFLFISAFIYLLAQDDLGVGLGLYPTGNEPGFGFRSSKQEKLVLDARIARTAFILKPSSGSFVNEVSLLYKICYYEKVRFHIGLGVRTDWNIQSPAANRYGAVVPFGVEAYPFPFQNAGLFFEVAPYFTADRTQQQQIGIRTASGFVFYFNKKKHETN